MHTEMALEITELPRQFVTDFAFKVVGVDAACVSIDVVFADVVLADDGIGLVADALDDAVWHRGVLLCECLRSVVVNTLSVDYSQPVIESCLARGWLSKSMSGRLLLNCNFVEGRDGPARGSFDRFRDWNAIDFLEQGGVQSRVLCEAIQLKLSTRLIGGPGVVVRNFPPDVIFD